MLSVSQMPTLRSVSRLKAALEDRLARVVLRQRMVRLELESRRLQEGSEEARELAHEQADLRGIEQTTRKAIAEIERRDTTEEARRHEESVRIFVAEAERQFRRSQTQWQQVGDFRSGRLYRTEFLDIRLKVEHEIGGLQGIPR